MEELVLLSQSARGRRKQSEKPQKILLSHSGNATAIKENVWSKGMFLVPWANRIAYVSYCGTWQDDIPYVCRCVILNNISKAWLSKSI